ncbi:hypothetical protein ACOSQ2_027793 [Xanthoceras sorbifolium]
MKIMKFLDFILFMRAAVMTIRIAADKFLFEQFEFVTCCLHDWIYQFWTLLLCYYGSPFILNVVGLKICVCRNQGGHISRVISVFDGSGPGAEILLRFYYLKNWIQIRRCVDG